MKSEEFRSSPLILRNEFPTTDLGMPVLKKVQLPKIDGCLSYHDTRIRDKRAEHNSYLIHFFKDDYRFEYLYEKPYGRSGKAGVQRLAQYSVVCTPDFSLFPEMPTQCKCTKSLKVDGVVLTGKAWGFALFQRLHGRMN